MRREPELAHACDEVFGVVVLVRRHRPPALPRREPRQHVGGAVPLSEPRRLGQLGIDNQPAAVLDQQVPQVGQFRRGVVGLAEQHRLRIGAGGVGLVRPFLALEVDFGVAALEPVAITVVVAAVVGFEALVRRPRLQQCPIHTEVIRRHVTAQLRLGHHRREEDVGDLVIQQALPVLRERGRVEGPVIDRQVQEPLEQHVVVQALTKRPLRTDRIHRHQHRGLQQRLRRHRPPARRRVHRVELAVEAGEHLVDHDPDPPDRMISRDQILGRQRRQHRQLTLRGSTHPPILFDPDPEREHQSGELQHPARRMVPGVRALGSVRAICWRGGVFRSGAWPGRIPGLEVEGCGWGPRRCGGGPRRCAVAPGVSCGFRGLAIAAAARPIRPGS